ncbi:MAG: hypothetical protein M1834_006827 [Cirrosporium novae-zelandiae]|nr:MAG: hypothetical protein M1834_006827 [Cirrosporium novae-zelandiae]
MAPTVGFPCFNCGEPFIVGGVVHECDEQRAYVKRPLKVANPDSRPTSPIPSTRLPAPVPSAATIRNRRRGNALSVVVPKSYTDEETEETLRPWREQMSRMSGGNAFPSFLDTSQSSNNLAGMPRQSPSVVSSQAAQMNGLAALTGGMSLGMPMNAGQASDMQIVYNMVGELSELLKKSRDKTANVMRLYQDLRVRAAHAGVDLGNLPESSDEETAGESYLTSTFSRVYSDLVLAGVIADLEQKSAELKKESDDLKWERSEDWKLIHEYEDSVCNMTKMARDYCTNDKLKYIGQKRYYNNQLQKERDAHLATRLDRDHWHAQAMKAMGVVRHAYRLRVDEEDVPCRVIYELQLQVREYRKLLGLDPEKEEEESGWEVLKDWPEDYSALRRCYEEQLAERAAAQQQQSEAGPSS